MPVILAINGSPRKNGNTHVLLSTILEAAARTGARTELVHLGDMAIRECDGCHACWKGRRCSKADDLVPFYAEIAAADVLVLGTPVYWYGPTGLMKTLIDRFVYFNCPDNRPGVRGKPVALAIPLEENDPATARPVLEFFERCLTYLEMRCAGSVVAHGVTARGEVRDREAYMVAAARLGEALARPSEHAPRDTLLSG